MSHDLERKLSHMLKLDKEKTLKEINEFGYAFISSANALREYIKSVNDYKLNQFFLTEYLKSQLLQPTLL